MIGSSGSRFIPSALALALAGCSGSSPPMAAAPAQPAPSTRAEQVAAILMEAASAEQSGNAAALGRAVQALDRTGAHALEGFGEDPLPGWRSRAGISEAPMRGSPLGPGYRSGRISAGGRDSFAQLFLSGTGATIALSAPLGDRVSLRVIDPQARTVCDESNKKDRMCRWVPLFTQRYTIEVVNMGASDARYFLVVE
jgi:hypothetical protein